MKYTIDDHGRPVIEGKDVFSFIANRIDLSDFIINFDDTILQYNKVCEDNGKDEYKIAESSLGIEIYDQKKWNVPDEYFNIDILELCLSLCSTENERQRVSMEIEMFKERDMLELLSSLIYMIDTFRNNNILWGVGRGSSVASYVLFLLGVHRIDSIKYGLDIHEFLR